MLVKNCIKFSNPFFLSNRKKMFFHEYKEQLFKETKEYLADHVILATGHSADDIYYLLDKKKIVNEADV